MKIALRLKTLFSRMLLTFTLLLGAAILVVSTILFLLFSNFSTRQITAIAEKTVMQSRSSVEYLGEQARKLCASLAYDNQAVQLMNMYFRDQALELRVGLEMRKLMSLNSSIYSISVFNAKSSSFISTEYVKDRDQTISMLQGENGRSFIDFVPRKLSSAGEGGSNVLSVYFRNKSGNGLDVQNAVIVDLKESSIRETLSNVGDGDKGSILVVDGDGGVISGISEAEFGSDYSAVPYVRVALGKRMDSDAVSLIPDHGNLVTHCFSEKLNWHFFYILPIEDAMKEISFIRNIAILTCAFILLLGAAASFYFSGNISSPYRKLVAVIKEDGGRNGIVRDLVADDSEVLSRFYADAIDKIEKLSIRQLDSANMRRDLYLAELLQGKRIASAADKAEYHLTIDYSGSRALRICFLLPDMPRIGRYPEGDGATREKIINGMRTIAMETLSAGYRFDSVQIGERIVLVLEEDPSSANDRRFFEGVMDLQENIHRRVGVSVSVACGERFFDIALIGYSYLNLAGVANYRMVYGASCLLKEREVLEAVSDANDYPYGKEKALIEAIRLGKGHSVEPLVADIMDSIRKHRYDFLFLSLNHLLFSVSVVFSADVASGPAGDDGDFEGIFQSLREWITLEEIGAWLARYITGKMEQARAAKLDSNSIMAMRIAEYIVSHFCESSMSVESVGDRFGYNPVYFGKLFRDLFHLSFIDYVAQLRIEKAIDYLKAGDLSVKELSALVGFNNPTYFVTWFKKKTGKSPGDFRKTYTQQDGISG